MFILSPSSRSAPLPTPALRSPQTAKRLTLFPHICCHREVAWVSCALSGQPLKAPVVADPTGQLLNKDAALELLLGRKGAFADAAAEHRCAQGGWAQL